MCVVSNMGDYGRTVPLPNTQPWTPTPTPAPQPAVPPWTRETFEMFKEMLELARKFDRESGQPDCDVPDKLDWMKEVERRLEELEKAKKEGK